MILLLATALSLAPAAQDLSLLANMAGIDGTCKKLTVAGSDRTADCPTSLINIAYKNARSSFMVQVGDDSMVSFYGDDHAATGNTATLVLRSMTITRLGQTHARSVPATGECTYTNPYAGPSHVECHATTAEGDYALSFVSDGKPPHVTHF
jgi:hypothetical protein